MAFRCMAWVGSSITFHFSGCYLCVWEVIIKIGYEIGCGNDGFTTLSSSTEPIGISYYAELLRLLSSTSYTKVIVTEISFRLAEHITSPSNDSIASCMRRKTCVT